ncbi:MAG: ssDNA-binding protein [Pseudohongiellaceae bacterium]
MSDEETRLVSPEFTVVWPHLFKPYHYKGSTDQAKFSAEMMFDEDAVDMQPLIDAATAAAKAKWPNRPLKGLKLPFKKGDTIADEAAAKGKKAEHYRGHVVVRAKSTYQPVICDANYGEILDERRVFPGCKGVAELTFVAYENAAAGDGVTCYLNAYMHIGEGPRIGGRDASKIFGSVDTSNFDPEEPAGEDAENLW